MTPKRYPLSKWNCSLTNVDPDALDAVLQLQNAGYAAYIVGGGVRDLLLGGHPKDFDISTSAKPDEVKHLFGKRCLLIGRRFRLAHLRVKGKIFEISTFRAGDTSSGALIVRDNRWGSEEEDVLRRDFTINALYLDPKTEEVIDYVGGIKDIQAKILETVGDPVARFQQDPVRMIRLLKFQARLHGFTIEAKTAKALQTCRDEIVKSAPARVLEEIFKMLESKKAASFFHLMNEAGFLKLLFPCFEHFHTSQTKHLAQGYLKALDEYHKDQKHLLDRSIQLAALVFPILEQEIAQLTYDRGVSPSLQEVASLSQSLLHGISATSFSHFPKRTLALCHLALVHQFKLTPMKSAVKFHSRFTTHFDFELALDLLKLRAVVHPELDPILLQWMKEHQRRMSRAEQHDH